MMLLQPLKHSAIFALLIGLTLAAGCQPAAAPTPAQTAEADTAGIPAATETPPAEPAAEQPSPAAAVDPLESCPREEPGKNLYVSEINGFCFLYPAGFTPQPDELRPEQVVKLIGPREETGPKQMEAAAVTVWAASNGRADVPDSLAYAQKWRALNIQPGEPVEIGLETAVIGGHPAAVLDGLPGMIQQRAGFVIANGFKYTLTISPQPGFVTGLDEPVRLAWEMITSTIRFFPPLVPPETVSAGQVCPQAGPGMRLLVREAEGYCFLYPEDFEINHGFSGRVEGGQFLGNWDGFENVRVSLTVGSYPMLASDKAQTPREYAAGISDVDPASVQDRTIGGARAVVFRVNPPLGPWASRQAYILTTDGRVYTIVNDPWEPERWPESSAPFEAVWEAVTGSLKFFTPWR